MIAILSLLLAVLAFRFYSRIEASAICWVAGLSLAPIPTLALTLPAALLLYWLENRPGSARWARKRIRNLYAANPPAPAPARRSHGDRMALVGLGVVGCVLSVIALDGAAAFQGGYALRWVLVVLGGTGVLVLLHAIGTAAISKFSRPPR